MMTASVIYSTRGDPHTHSYGPMSSLHTSPTASRVNTAHRTKRPSVKFKIPCGKSNILNSALVNADGQSLYKISSNSKRTTFVACKNSVEVATVQWDRSSPRMVFRRKKMKCKEWLSLAGPRAEYEPAPLAACRISESGRDLARSESRVLTHGDSQFNWMQRSSSSSGYVCICCY